jgi:hypothetical protein
MAVMVCTAIQHYEDEKKTEDRSFIPSVLIYYFKLKIILDVYFFIGRL